MSRTVAIIQARVRSARLPGKTLYELAGRPMFRFMIERVRRTPSVDDVVLATGAGAENDPLAAIAAADGIPVFRGPEDDVLARYAGAARAFAADVVVRLTGDCPLADPTVIAAVIDLRSAEGLDFATNVLPPTWPDGLDVAVFTREVLDLADRAARKPSEREHVVPWMWAQSNLQGGDRLRAGNLRCPEDLAGERWTVDDPMDYLMLRALADALGPARLLAASWRDIAAALDARPAIRAINRGGERDAGLAQSRAADPAC